jgi:hypothetical protein
MKHHQHTQYAREINRRLFQTKTERRAQAAADFITAVACIAVFAFIGVLLAWRG